MNVMPPTRSAAVLVVSLALASGCTGYSASDDFFVAARPMILLACSPRSVPSWTGP